MRPTVLRAALGVAATGVVACAAVVLVAPETSSAVAPATTRVATTARAAGADGATTPVLTLSPLAPAPDGAPGQVAAAIAGAERADLREGARRIAETLAASERSSDVMAMGAAVASDPDMLPLVEGEARRLAASTDPALRARGLVLLAALGALDVRGWRDAVAAERDPAARARIVDAPPFGRDARADAKVAAALLDVAAADPSTEVRAAAVRALPRALDEAQVGAVVSLLRQDQATEVRRVAAAWLRGARPTDPGAVRGLVTAALTSAEDREVRRAAVVAALRIEDRAPGALAQAGTTLDAMNAVLAQVSDDRG